MKWQRRTTSTPGVSMSTTKAVILLRPSVDGVRAMTTITPALTPFVHQSFSPLMMKCAPSGVGSARTSIFAGSLPTFGSVSAKAETSPAATRGSHRRFCASLPKRMSGCGTPMD